MYITFVIKWHQEHLSTTNIIEDGVLWGGNTPLRGSRWGMLPGLTFWSCSAHRELSNELSQSLVPPRVNVILTFNPTTLLLKEQVSSLLMLSCVFGGRGMGILLSLSLSHTRTLFTHTHAAPSFLFFLPGSFPPFSSSGSLVWCAISNLSSPSFEERVRWIGWIVNLLI